MVKFISTAFCFLIIVSGYAVVPEERISEFRKLINDFKLVDGPRTEENYFSKWIMNLNSDEKEALIPIVRQHRDRPGSVTREDWNGLLAYLGDEVAVKMNIDNSRNHGAMLEVARAASGQVPVYLEPELFIQEVHKPGGGSWVMEESFSIAMYLLDYLEYNKNYPRAVRQWAARTVNTYDEAGDPDPTAIRRVTRDWYRANEKFIRAKAYEQVKVGEELPPKPDHMMADSLPPPLPSVLPRHENSAASRPGRDQGTNPPGGAPASEAGQKSFGWNGAIAVSIFVLVVVAVIFKNFRRQRKQ